MTAHTTTGQAAIERVHADHATVKHLGNWTTASRFEVRARSASTVLDLRSPEITGDVAITVDLNRALLTVLVPDDAAIDHWNLEWTGRGRVKGAQGPSGAAGRVIRLAGAASGSEVRVHRGGVAILTAMFSRDYVRDVRRAHSEGTAPTVDDPTR